MNDTNFASLNSTLLARKGGAKPAMRRQVAAMPTEGDAATNLEDLGWNDMGDETAPQKESKVLHLTPEPTNAEAEAEAKQNDKIADKDLAASPGSAPVNARVTEPVKKPIVVEQQEALSEKVAIKIAEPAPTLAPEPAKKAAKPVRKRRSALARGKRAAFTLRLDAERHLKLRLASTLRGHSAQQLVTQALDKLLGDMPDVNALAAQAKNTD